MANETTVVLTGVLEDEQGRKLMPDTYASQVVHSDGETSEYKLANLVKVSSNMAVTMAGAETRKVVDLSAYITNKTALPTSASLFTTTASVPLMCRIAGRSRRPTLSWKQEKA